MATWLASRKVRHLGVMHGDSLSVSVWRPLCHRYWRHAPSTMWLGSAPMMDLVEDGNHRRAMAARWRKPACTRCLSELSAMTKLVADDTVSRALATVVDNIALHTGRPPAEVLAQVDRALVGPARPLSTSGPVPL